MSKLLQKATEEARNGHEDIRQQVRNIGNKFLNSVEISAQEAVYLLLQLPMRKASRSVIFINTNAPEDRVCLLKPIEVLDEMDDNSEDIESNNIIKRYSNRPKALETRRRLGMNAEWMYLLQNPWT